MWILTAVTSGIWAERTKMKRVLSIDGGGIRGIIPAVVLDEFERCTRRKCIDIFDMLVGTSTGGLLCLGAVHPQEFTANKLLELFIKKGSKIFKDPRSKLQRAFRGPKYSADGLT